MRKFLGYCCLALHLLVAQAHDTLNIDAAAATPFVPREFMLTFDDGPLPDRTEKVLQALQHLKNPQNQPVKAAFFMIGDTPDFFLAARAYHAPYEIWIDKGSMRAYPDIVAQVRQAGHYIGNHTHHHGWFYWPWLTSQSAISAEIQNWEPLTAQSPEQAKLFRPPYLINNASIKAAAKQHGYQIVLGVTVGDASPTNTVADIQKNIMALLAQTPNNGTPVVLIFHDVIAMTYENLGEIVEFVQKQGHRLVDFDPARLPREEARTEGKP